MAREANALSFVDAVHYAPHQLVDVREWGCDFLACSAYKFHGPHVGVLYGKREQLEVLDLPKLQPAPRRCPRSWKRGRKTTRESSARPPRWIISPRSPGRPPAFHPCSRRERLQAVFEAFHERGRALLKRLWEGLSEIEGVTIYGPPPSAPRTPTLAFTLAGRPAEEVSRLLAARGIFASHGNFYAMTVVERLGVADQRPGPAGLCLLHDRGRGRSGDRRRAVDRPGLIPDRGSERACSRPGRSVIHRGLRIAARRGIALLRELGMRVQRVEVLVPDRVEEAVERHRSRFGIAIDIAGDALRAGSRPGRRSRHPPRSCRSRRAGSASGKSGTVSGTGWS